jgi:CpeS-like protein
MHVTVPMTMMDFFRKSAGSWFSQREVHHYDLLNNETTESNLIIQVVDRDDPRVSAICTAQQIDPTLAQGGGAFLWQQDLDDVEPNPDYAAVLIDVPDDATGRSGKLIRNKGYVEIAPVICRYWFGQDGILTIDTEYENNQGQERCWFVTDDFRIRVSTVKLMDGVQLSTYSSERRCVAPDRLAEFLAINQQRVTATASA